MATETVPAEGVTITAQRRLLGLEAAWEINALRETVNGLCGDLEIGDMTQLEQVELRLKVRGLTLRIGQLAGVVMSVLDDDDTTAALFKTIHGLVPAVEVSHG